MTTPKRATAGNRSECGLAFEGLSERLFSGSFSAIGEATVEERTEILCYNNTGVSLD